MQTKIVRAVRGLYKIGSRHQRKGVLVGEVMVRPERCHICGELKSGPQQLKNHLRYVHGCGEHLNGVA